MKPVPIHSVLRSLQLLLRIYKTSPVSELKVYEHDYVKTCLVLFEISSSEDTRNLPVNIPYQLHK